MIYNKIVFLCNEKGISPTKLSNEIGISPTVFGRWRDGVKPQSRMLKKVADYFGVPIDYFSDNEKKPELNIVELDGFKLYNLPVYEDIAAGFGATAHDYITDYMPLPLKSESEAEESLVFHVVGDSMQPKIENGDYVQVRKQTSVDSGDIAAVLLDEEKGLLKKVIYGADYISLISLNPSYEPIVFAGKDVLRVRILGKVKKIIREP